MTEIPVVAANGAVKAERNLFRAAVGEAIKNSHTAIKNCWTILFTGGTVVLVVSFDRLVECKYGGNVVGFDCSQLAYRDDWRFVMYFGFIAVYLLTFYRFYVGNIRAFDIRYDEVFKFVASLTKEKLEQEDEGFKWLIAYNDQSDRLESIYLILQTLVIIYLTVAVTTALKFEIAYLALLWFDMFWLAWTRIGGNPKISFRQKFIDSFEKLGAIDQKKKSKIKLNSEEKKIFSNLEMMFPSRAVVIWSWNNFVFAILLSIVVVPMASNRLGVEVFPGIEIFKHEDWLLIIGLGLMIANCLVDLIWTWIFYNPRYTKLTGYLFD
jgi:hypothetical protein